MKKALKNIDKIKDASVSEKDNAEKIKSLLEIGDLINDHLGTFNDPKKINEWRNFLWIFVAKFTPWDSERLKNLYKRFASTRDEEVEEQQNRSSLGGNNANRYSSTSNSNTSSLLGQRPVPSLLQNYNINSSERKKSSSNSDFWRGGGERDAWDNNYKNSNSRPPTASSSFHNNKNYHRSADYDSHNHQHHQSSHSTNNSRYNVYSPNSSFNTNHHRLDHNTSSHSYNDHLNAVNTSHHQNYFSPNDFSSRSKANPYEHYKYVNLKKYSI